MAFYYQSTPYTRLFTLVQSENHVLALTGASPTTIISKAGASFIYSDVAAVEIATGWYKLSLTTTTTNTIGDLAFHVTASLADDRDWVDQVLAGVQVATVVQGVKDDLTNQIWATASRTVALTDANRAEVVSSVWATPTRSLQQTAYDQLTNQIWATASRTVTAGTVTTVSGIGTRAEIVSSVWATPDRSLTAWDGIVSAVWATPTISQPSGVFSWVNTTAAQVLAWLGAMSSNKLEETSTAQVLSTRAGVAIATSTVSDDGTTGTRGSFS